MRNWKQPLLSLYYHVTLPYRAWQNRRARAAGMSPVMVLFYHRIADDAASPWTLSNDDFVQQMRWLKERFDLISLEEAQRRIRGQRNERPAVSVTFDDGYADNCEKALPFLIAEKIPCTYFISTRHVLQGVPFPHDVERNCLSRPNTLEEIRSLAAAGVEIGAHTRSHANLGRLHDPRKLHDEVVVSGEELQQVLGHSVRYFAFPFGLPANLNSEVFHLAHEYGYEGVCSAYGGYNFPGDDAFHLQRIHADSMLRLKNWTTVDPRKLRNPYRFNYQSPPLPQPAGAMAP